MIEYLVEEFDPVTHERFLMLHADRRAMDRLEAGEIVVTENNEARLEEELS